MTTLLDRIGQTTPTVGTGNLTLGSALTSSTNGNYLSLGASQDGISDLPILIVDGSAWELNEDCEYTHATATLTRGTMVASSTGARLSLSGTAKIYVTLSAAIAQSAVDAAATAVQPGDDAAGLGSGSSTDGYVLTSDGLGGAAWEVLPSDHGALSGLADDDHPQYNTAAQTNGATSKATPADADEIPLADSAASYALKKLTWANLKADLDLRYFGAINTIGTPGNQGFGVGICPSLPAGYTAMTGCTDPASPNYGNYQYSDGSVMCWIPAFYYRINDSRNPTYAGHTTNSVDVQPYSAFADVATANAAGYALHRAFYDGGSIQPGFFVDKYKCSNNSGTASSIKFGNPLSTHATDHNPIGALTGTPDSNYGGCFAAAKTRGAAFFPATIFIRSALALLALAHGQAATTNAWCAWYDAAGTNNFPKGCNNNALKDQNDNTVVYQSDGYSNCGKTGSATNFAKTTHNGQACGVADLNGLMWEVSPGITCVSGTKAITGITLSNPVDLLIVGHGRATGEIVMATGIVGTTQLNSKLYTCTVVDADHITLDGVDGSGMTAYTSGGTLTYGTFYALNTSYAAKHLTGSNTLATDQWGATGVAAHSAAIVPTFRTDYPQNGFDKRYGRGTNQVLSAATSGAGWTLTGLGVPLSTGISDGTSGTNLFGNDYLYQYIRNELCLISGAGWYNGSIAGVWAALWYDARTDSDDSVGFRAASYL